MSVYFFNSRARISYMCTIRGSGGRAKTTAYNNVSPKYPFRAPHLHSPRTVVATAAQHSDYVYGIDFPPGSQLLPGGDTNTFASSAFANAADWNPPILNKFSAAAADCV